MKQIVAVPLDYMACGELRIANPARFMQMMGMDVTLLPATKFRGIYQDNIIFTQRLITNEVIGLIKKLKDQLNCKVVVDYDDMIWTYKGEGLPEYNHCKSKVNCDANAKAMKDGLNDVADAVICTNEYLKVSLSEFVPLDKITVIPNMLPVNQWMIDKKVTVPSKDIFLFAGSNTHFDNENKLPGDFSNGLIHYLQNKQVITAGDPPYFINPAAKVPLTPMATYASVFRQYTNSCKFILAPLADNVFNKSKSDLKYLESCAVGRVCLCNDFEDSPYSNVHPYQKIPVDATSQTIEFIVERAKKHYGEILEYQYEYLKQRWLENHLQDYIDIFNKL